MVQEQRQRASWINGMGTGRILTFEKAKNSFVTDHHSKTAVTVSNVTGALGFRAVIFRTAIHEDIDGAPTTYAPPISATNHDPIGGVPHLDHINNATNGTPPVFHPQSPTDLAPNTWVWTGVMSMTPEEARTAGRRIDDRDFLKDAQLPAGRFPVFQDKGPERDRYYVGQTAINLKSGDPVDPTRYPYGALSGALKQEGVRKGDFGLAIRVNGVVSSPFIYADAGGATSNSVGEYSTKLIENLFDSRNPNSENICIMAFPGSRAVDNYAEPELMDGVVRNMIANLNSYENVEDLPEYWANPDAWEATGVLHSMVRKNGLQSIYRSGAHQIRMALTSWGLGRSVPANKMMF